MEQFRTSKEIGLRGIVINVPYLQPNILAHPDPSAYVFSLVQNDTCCDATSELV